jgi:DNA-binding NtrC family response regulator
MGKILVVDDDEGMREFLVESLARDGHDVVTAGDGDAALAMLHGGAFDLVLTDLQIPGTDGMSILRAVRAALTGIEVIVLTAHGSVATAVQALKLGAFDYLEKPIPSPAVIRALAGQALERRRERAGPAQGAGPLSRLPTRLTWGAPAMKPIVEAVERVAASPATVLLQGESGTGKEVFASAIHALSPRADQPFVAVNCAVLSESLLESELFGHEKGAFTGAHAQRIGRIEGADRGTFFLDEVGELVPATQAKLLRVLEERRFERVGGSRPISVDVRWIAATNKNLRGMVRSGTFREDLYHRLAVFPIRLPPLRERRADIVPIAVALLARLTAGTGRAPPKLDDGTKARLEAEPWPANVRELRNALERALILADGPVLRPEHLWFESISVYDDELPGESPGAAPTALVDVERQTIERALAAAGGNRREAAASLGIGLRTLYDKLKRYSLK